MNTAVQVTMYLNESDRWHHKPLHAEILQFLRKENVAGASAFHAVAGFNGRNRRTYLESGRGRRELAGRDHLCRF